MWPHQIDGCLLSPLTWFLQHLQLPEAQATPQHLLQSQELHKTENPSWLSLTEEWWMFDSAQCCSCTLEHAQLRLNPPGIELLDKNSTLRCSEYPKLLRQFFFHEGIKRYLLTLQSPWACYFHCLPFAFFLKTLLPPALQNLLLKIKKKDKKKDKRYLRRNLQSIFLILSMCKVFGEGSSLAWEILTM